jgi:hypothetical protein
MNHPRSASRDRLLPVLERKASCALAERLPLQYTSRGGHLTSRLPATMIAPMLFQDALLWALHGQWPGEVRSWVDGLRIVGVGPPVLPV